MILRQIVTELCASLPALYTFVQYSNAFCSRPETGSDVMSGKFVCDPRLNRFPEIRPEAVGNGIFDRFCELRSLPIGRASDIISDKAVYATIVGVPVKCVDSKSNRSRDT